MCQVKFAIPGEVGDGGARHRGGARVLVELVGGKHLQIITEVRLEVLEVVEVDTVTGYFLSLYLTEGQG